MDKGCQNSSKTKRFFSKIYNWIKNLVVTVSDKMKRCKAAVDIYYNSFSNSLIIHKENTKNINV